MNWKRRKIITAVTAIVTIGTLYATVGPRHYKHFEHGCHSGQSEHCHRDAVKAETPHNEDVVEE
tara:strand:- start:50615 stop:50806 length:192 start_codon:yes stop_codon:yes gene_type:complete